MNTFKYFSQIRSMLFIKSLAIIFAFIFAGCSTTVPSQTGLTADQSSKTRIDEVPMYGGMDRSAVPELQAGDEKFISEVTQQFGSREDASNIWVERGYKLYMEDKLGMAMRRFNQAWLLNPKNPNVFAGFGSVLHDRGKDCEAMIMEEKALSLNPTTNLGVYPDAGMIVSLCAVNSQSLSADEKTKLITRSEEIYKDAIKIESNKQYVYNSWGYTYYWRKQFHEALGMFEQQQLAGGSPDKNLMHVLRKKVSKSN
jgi:Tfp pilus assembly protein PilF